MSASDHFDRYVLDGDWSLAPVMRGRGPLVYVLEFANDEQYVGQTVNIRQRVASHRRRWSDMTAVRVRDVPQAELARIELETISAHRASGHVLRNRAHNYGHDQPSALDDIVPVVDQKHWALGHGTYDPTVFADTARQSVGPVPKLVKSALGRLPHATFPTVADAVIADLAAVIALAIPDPVSMEQTYWTISDYPSTSRGRMATLNTGIAEVLAISRDIFGEELPDGTVAPYLVSFVNLPANSPLPDDLPGVKWLNRDIQYFKSTRVDQLAVLLGSVGQVLEVEPVKVALRELVLDLMRLGTPSRWGRFHSQELARRAYQVAASTGEGRYPSPI